MATLRETQGARSGLDHAYNRLHAPAARAFRLLTVHPGPDASVAAVTALADLPADEARDALTSLAHEQMAETVAGNSPRWRLTDLARPYAEWLADQLATVDGREQARNRLFDYYLLATEAADHFLQGRPPIPAPQEFADWRGAVAWLDVERASLIAAVGVAAQTGRHHAAKNLPLLMGQYLGLRGLFDELLAVTTTSLHAAQLLDDRAAEGEALTNLGLGLHGLGRYDEALTAHRNSLAIFRQIGDPRSEGSALNNLGIALHRLHRDKEAVTAHEDAVDIFRQTGDLHGEGKSLNNLGLALRAERKLGAAAIAHQEAAAIFGQTGDLHGEGGALGNLGNVQLELSHTKQAVATLRRAVDIFREADDRRSELMAEGNLNLARKIL